MDIVAAADRQKQIPISRRQYRVDQNVSSQRLKCENLIGQSRLRLLARYTRE
jgi:hypothetical protein